MHVATHTVRAYAQSKRLTMLEAFRELYAIFTYGKRDFTILPSDSKRIMKDLDVYNRKGVIPSYVLRGLELERTRFLQAQARRSYDGHPLFV